MVMTTTTPNLRLKFVAFTALALIRPCCLMTQVRQQRSTTDCAPGLEDLDLGFYVFLTVNALVQTRSRALELNWTTPPGAKATDWVGLFRSNPVFRNSDPLVRVNALDHDGYFKTNYRFPDYPLQRMYSGRESCLFGYWIGYVSDNVWMWNEREVIGDIPLHALMIPGTHNSGAYKVIDDSFENNFLTRYTVNQVEDVWHQLVYGIRYLDLRISKFDDPEKFWVMHDLFKMNPLYLVLQDVRRFLSQAKNEIVIMDFHRFPEGFEDRKSHQELIQYLREELHEFIAPDWVGRDVTPNDLWRMNRTLIISYSHDPSSVESEHLWFEVRHAWGNTADVRDLKSFLADSMYRRYSATYLWAAMAHLTPSQLDVLFDLGGGFARLSDKIARNITRWFRDEWWDSANLVASDFFLGNNLIEESIRANRKRRRCRDRYSWLG